QPVTKAIFSRAAIHLKEGPVWKNHFLDYQLRGKYSVALPMYLRPETFETIKQNIDRLHFFHGSLSDIPPEEKFDILNLSNIFEYMNAAAFKVQSEQIAACCHPNARIAYWNLLVDRKLPVIDPRFTQLEPLGEDLCFFYQSFNLNTYR
ncbi:MAG: DUF3419 family protein, partial [Chitinophagaceae bacterium]|nr:DUF3419 family protein [Chitinophagaceae bacterium]